MHVTVRAKKKVQEHTPLLIPVSYKRPIKTILTKKAKYSGSFTQKTKKEKKKAKY